MVISFVPMRSGSKSIIDKNIKDFCGKPLCYWTLKELQNCPLVDIIVVAIDSAEYQLLIDSFNFPKIIIYHRKFENAQDDSTTESVMLEYLMLSKHKNEDIFILAQVTNPFIESNNYSDGIEQLKIQNLDSLLTCTRIKRFFWDEYGNPLNYDYTNRPRRQEFTGTLVENGAFYISYVGNILKAKNRLFGKIGHYEMDPNSLFEIDEIEDWVIAKKLMKYKLSKNKIIKSKPIKLLLSDIDGVLTDGGMYYSESGEMTKKFNTKDGMGFELLKRAGIKTGLITSETSIINENRYKKLNIDHLYQGVKYNEKLSAAKEICIKENINLDQICYIGDDINCQKLLLAVAISACPSDAINIIKELPNIIILKKKGGQGVLREFADLIINFNQSLKIE